MLFIFISWHSAAHSNRPASIPCVRLCAARCYLPRIYGNMANIEEEFGGYIVYAVAVVINRGQNQQPPPITISDFGMTTTVENYD